MADIIEFPKHNPRAEILTPELAQDKLDEFRMDAFELIADELVDNVALKVGSLGLANDDIDLDLFAADCILLRETIISMMCRLSKTKHPLHDLHPQIIDVKNAVDVEGNSIYVCEIKKPISKESLDQQLHE